MSSKFSTPFMNKSPLHGAYTSGAGGMVYVSNRQAFQKLQNDITSATKQAIAGKAKKDKKELEFKTKTSKIINSTPKELSSEDKKIFEVCRVGTSWDYESQTCK
jgi:hypothetical protein